MIIRLDSSTAGNAEAARRSLSALARSWGHQITEPPARPATAAATTHNHGKGIDPVQVASLVVSIPSAALAVLDLADRIRKRRRARELIEHAQQLAAQQVTVSLICQGSTVELCTLTPDQLLGLLTGDDLAR